MYIILLISFILHSFVNYSNITNFKPKSYDPIFNSTIFHFRYDKGIIGDPINQWLDDANDYNAIQNTEENRPNNDIGNNQIDFDGSDDCLEISDNDIFSFGDGSSDIPFSISGYINMDDATNLTIVSKYISGGLEWRLGCTGSDELIFILYDQSATAYIRQKSAVITNYQGSWKYIVATYDGTGVNGITLYVNGEILSSSPETSGTYVGMENGNQPVTIGRALNVYCDGKIRDVELWNSELTADQILTLYNEYIIINYQD